MNLGQLVQDVAKAEGVENVQAFNAIRERSSVIDDYVRETYPEKRGGELAQEFGVSEGVFYRLMHDLGLDPTKADEVQWERNLLASKQCGWHDEWARSQRRLMNRLQSGKQRPDRPKNELSPARIARLNEEEFDWNPRRTKFEEMLSKSRETGWTDRSATGWRGQFGQGTLAPHQEERLNEEGFIWSLKDARWEENFREAQRAGWETTWVNNQRAQRRRVGERFPADRLRRMNEAGFPWEPPNGSFGPGKPKYPRLHDEAWLREKLAEHTQAEVARMIGCGDNDIYKARKRYGIAAPVSGRVKSTCINGHDTSTPEARTKRGVCVVCDEERTERLRQERLAATAAKPKLPRSCAWCDKEFEVTTKQWKRRFCSKECIAEDRNDRARQKAQSRTQCHGITKEGVRCSRHIDEGLYCGKHKS